MLKPRRGQCTAALYYYAPPPMPSMPDYQPMGVEMYSGARAAATVVVLLLYDCHFRGMCSTSYLPSVHAPL